MKVGIIGLGRMGAGIAANIVRAGHSVVVWNRSRAALAPLLELGAAEAGTAGDALRGDMLISMLANDQAFADVGLDGPLLAEASSALVHLNTSTVSVELARQLAKKFTPRRGSRTLPRQCSAARPPPPREPSPSSRLARKPLSTG